MKDILGKLMFTEKLMIFIINKIEKCVMLTSISLL